MEGKNSTKNHNSFRAIEAAAFGDSIKLSKLIKNGISVNARDWAGRTALHLACSEGRLEAVSLLLKHRADVTAKDREGHEPLHDACLSGHRSIVDVLVRAGATLSPEFRNEMEMKIRHFAARGELDKIKYLNRAGIWIEAADYIGRTALHAASENGHQDVVEYLLSRGADANGKDRFGQTALMLAENRRHIAVKELLSRSSVLYNAPPIKLNKRRWRTRGSMKASFTVLQAFPAPIAAAMLEGRKVEPFSKSMVSLLYSDICGFTTISSTMSAQAVSEMLTRIFRKFDQLALLHGIQKVDVIGDAYIAACNFTAEQPEDHAARLSRFAIDMMTAARETPLHADDPDPQEGIPLRIGLHCGPVSAMVVGEQAVKYTLMGQTAQMASKMESSGLPGRIQCSSDFAEIVAAQANDVMTKPR